LASNSNWNTVLADYQANGWLTTRALVDSLSDVQVSLDEAQAMDSRKALFRLEFPTETEPALVMAAATIRQHVQPTD
jgi:hypothetical protein